MVNSATSDPKGPVYLWARREAMEEEVADPSSLRQIDIKQWKPSERVTLPETGMSVKNLDIRTAFDSLHQLLVPSQLP